LKEKPVSQTPVSSPVGEYILMPERATYALGVHALQEQCIKENNQNQPKFTLPDGRVIYRPNTFKENCLARLHQFNTYTNPDGSKRTLDQRIEFMLIQLDSCSGLAFPAQKRNNRKFKLILKSPELIDFPNNFNDFHFLIDYDRLDCTRELDCDGAKYGTLTPAKIDSHEGWLTLFEDDKVVLRDYRQAVEETIALWDPLTPGGFMDFYLLNLQKDDHLLAVRLGSSAENHSTAYGQISDQGCRFLRRKP